MEKFQKHFVFRFWGLTAAITCGLTLGSSMALCAEKPGAHATTPQDVHADTLKLEEDILIANTEEISRIELKVARLLQENPSDITANYLMSTLLLKMYTLDPGSYSLIKQSTELAAQTYDLDRRSDLGVAALANILETSGEFERGLSLLNEATKRGHKLGWRSGLAKAKLLSNLHDHDLVLRQLDKVVSDPNASHALVAPTLISAILEKYEGEDQVKEMQGWSRRCKAISFELALASSYAMNGRNGEAAKIYEAIILRDPSNMEALLNDGVLYLKNQKMDLAIQRFRSAVVHAIYPGDKIAAKTHLALALVIHKKDPEGAMKAAYDAIKSAGDSEGVLVGILAAYRRHGTVQATLAFLDGLEYNVPGLHLGYAIKAELLSEKMGRHYDAMRSFTNAITLDPGRSEYYNGRGLAWMGIGRLETALADFESATMANPDDASARYNVACALARLGRKEDALASLGKAFELDERLLVHAQTDQDLSSLRSEPAFRSFFNGAPSNVTVAH